MSKEHTSRHGTQTPSFVYLPLRVSSNIPAFVSAAVQGSKTTIEDELIVYFNERDENPERKTSSSKGEVPGGLGTLPDYQSIDNGWNSFGTPEVPGEQTFYTLPSGSPGTSNAHYGSPSARISASACPSPLRQQNFVNSGMDSAALAYEPTPQTENIRQPALSGRPHTFVTLPPNSAIERTRVAHCLRRPRADFRSSFSGRQQNFVTLPPRNSNIERVPVPYNYPELRISGAYTTPVFRSTQERFYRLPPDGSIDRTPVRFPRKRVRVRPFSYDSNVNRNISSGFRSIPQSTDITNRDIYDYVPTPFNNTDDTFDTISHGSTIRRNDLYTSNDNTYYAMPFDCIGRGAHIDNDTRQGRFDFRRLLNNTTNYYHYGRRYEKGVCIPSNNSVGGVSNAMIIPRPVRLIRRLRQVPINQTHLSSLPEEISHGTQSLRIPYMTRLSKCYRPGEADLTARPSPISTQQLSVQGTQSPSSIHLRSASDSANPLDNYPLLEIPRSYGHQSIVLDRTERDQAPPGAGRGLPVHRQSSPLELERGYVSRRLSPTVLNRIPSNPAAKPSSPLRAQSRMTRTLCSPRALSRVPMQVSASRRSRSPGTTDRKRDDILDIKKKIISNENYSNLPIIRRASMLDITSYSNGEDPPEIPLYKSYSDSSIDMTDESSYLPVPSKKVAFPNLKHFKPLPKLHEESLLKTEYGPLKESDYFQDEAILRNPTANSCLRRVIPRILQDMDNSSTPILAKGALPITVPRTAPIPVRSASTWEEICEEKLSTYDYSKSDQPDMNQHQKWEEPKRTKEERKDESKNKGEEGLTETTIENMTQNNQAISSLTSHGDVLKTTNSLKMADSNFRSESTFRRSDNASQIAYSTSTRGVQVRGSKTKSPNREKRRAMEEMFKFINDDVLY